MALLAGCAIAALLAACDRGEPEPAQWHGPAVNVLATEPRAQETAVPLQQAIRLRFSRHLRPSSVVRQSARITAGWVDPETGQTQAPTVFVEPVYDPYQRIVVLKLQPGARWEPSTLYSVLVRPPEDDTDPGGIRAVDGAPLDGPVEFSFMTAAQPSAEAGDDELPVVRFCPEDRGSQQLPPVYPLLVKSCGLAGCHRADGTRAAAMGLDLSTLEGIRSTALRVPARQRMMSPTVGASIANPSRFGDNMARIEPGNPGNSYLVYKLIVNENNYAGLDADTFDQDPVRDRLPPEPQAPKGELEALRSWLVRGAPMPRGGSLRPAEMRAIVGWITQGAPNSQCL